jgi:hypothetical protein
MRDLDQLFAALAGSEFRRRFRLGDADRQYLLRKTLPVVLEHGREFVRRRLSPAHPEKDGQQTPMRGHPFFVAQHATATCCRGCLAKWHFIEKDHGLTDLEIDHVLDACARWLRREIDRAREDSAVRDETNNGRDEKSTKRRQRRPSKPASDKQSTFWEIE